MVYGFYSYVICLHCLSHAHKEAAACEYVVCICVKAGRLRHKRVLVNQHHTKYIAVSSVSVYFKDFNISLFHFAYLN